MDEAEERLSFLQRTRQRLEEVRTNLAPLAGIYGGLTAINKGGKDALEIIETGQDLWDKGKEILGYTESTTPEVTNSKENNKTNIRSIPYTRNNTHYYSYYNPYRRTKYRRRYRYPRSRSYYHRKRYTYRYNPYYKKNKRRCHT